MSTKTAPAKPAAKPAVKVVSVKSTPAKVKAKDSAPTVNTSAKTKAAELEALKAAAVAQSTTALAESYRTASNTESTAGKQTEELLSMLDVAKRDASNARVLQARAAYLLATHPDISKAGKPNVLGAARIIVSTKDMAAPDAEKLARTHRVTLDWHVKAGADLAAKKLVWNLGDPTEAERAIVERSHDNGVRAKSAKGNAKTKAKAAAPKGTGTEDAGDALPDSVTVAEVAAKLATLKLMLEGMAGAGVEVTRAEADALVDSLSDATAMVEALVAE